MARAAVAFTEDAVTAEFRRLWDRVDTLTHSKQTTVCPSLLALERMEDGPTLGVNAVSTVLDLGPDLVRALCEAGDIRAFRVGQKYKIAWRSLRAYLFRIGALPLTADERTPARRAFAAEGR